MKRYTEYKDSGVSWIGEIPGHWEVDKVSKRFSQRNVKVSDKDYAPLSVSKMGVTTQLESAVKTDNGDNRKLVLEGDFVVNSRSDRKGSCGISPQDGSVSLINIVLKPSHINRYYCHYLLRSNDYIEEFYRNGRGIVADLWTTRYQEMKSIMIPIPTPAEQEKIVAFLDKQTNLIESCICLRERELQTLNELKQAKIASAVTRGLNPDVPMKDSGIPWIGMIPAHWEIKKLKYLFNERSEKGYPDEPVLCSTQKYGVIPQSLYENRVVVVNKGLEGLKLVEVGDFVISLRSFQGGIEYAYYRGIISAAYTVLSPRKGINSEYLKHLLKSQPFIELLKTCVTGIREGQNINYSLLKNKEWAFPPPEEQDAIISYLTNRNIDEYIKSLEKEIEYLKEYKQRLISDVVTGKVDVRDEA